ncbi:MAG: hypothetical protein HUU06_03220 [Planctomycetaceae bacterium]|nr:hypothetical protein [Planctomycetaceae bacterium]
MVSVLVLSICIVAVLKAGPAGAGGRTLDADGIVIRDKDGTARMKIGPGQDGAFGLEFLGGPEGRSRGRISMDERGDVSAVVCGADGEERIRLGLDGDGKPMLLLIDPTEKAGIFSSFKKGFPEIILIGGGAHTRVLLWAEESKGAGLEVLDEKNRMRGVISAEAEGDAKMLLLGKDRMFQFPEKTPDGK